MKWYVNNELISSNSNTKKENKMSQPYLTSESPPHQPIRHYHIIRVNNEHTSFQQPTTNHTDKSFRQFRSLFQTAQVLIEFLKGSLKDSQP